LFIIGISFPTIGISNSGNSENYFIMHVFSCSIKVASRYEVYLSSEPGVRFSAPLAKGGGSIAYRPRKGSFEDSINNATIIKSVTKKGLDYISFRVHITKSESHEFIMIRDNKNQMLVGGQDIKDMFSVFESCAAKRKKE